MAFRQLRTAATARRVQQVIAQKTGPATRHLRSHAFWHTYRTWLDSVGTPVGVQQRLMRHADIRTTMNIYGDVVTPDVREASDKVAMLALYAGETAGKVRIPLKRMVGAIGFEPSPS